MICRMADYKILFFVLLYSAALEGGAVQHTCCEGESIQEAIDASLPGDTVAVESGTFREGLVVGRTIELHGRDTGEGRPILAPEGRIVLAAQGATLRGFSISRSEGCSVEVILPASILLNNIPGAESICPEAPSSWNSSQPVSYQFEGRVLRGLLGNHWADYEGVDEDGDGIGDMPYVLDEENVDYHPLIQPVESYRIEGEVEERMESISARIGEAFRISLPSNPTTGYHWTADYDYHLLSLEGQQFERSAPELVGAGGASTFVFLPKRPGRTAIHFVYRRPWENIVAGTRTFHVEISE